MSSLGLFFIILSVLNVYNALTPLSYMTVSDKTNLLSVFDSGIFEGFKSAKIISLSTQGYAILQRAFPKQNGACELFKSSIVAGGSIDDVYFSVIGSKNLKDCSLAKEVVDKQLVKLDDVTSLEALWKVVTTRQAVGLSISSVVVEARMKELAKKEGGGAISQAYSYRLVSELYGDDKKRLERYAAEMEDTLQQADEADGSLMYYADHGLDGTAFIVASIIQLTDKYGQVMPGSRDKLVKLTNFLLSRRHTRDLSSAVALAGALRALGNNRRCVPMVLTALPGTGASSVAVLQAHTVWGDPISGLDLHAGPIKDLLTPTTLTAGSLPGQYELDPAKPLPRGLYSLPVTVATTDARFEASSATVVSLIVLSRLSLQMAELSIREKEQLASAGQLLYPLHFGAAPLADTLTVNWHHRLELGFRVTLEGTPSVALRPHQVFLRLRHRSSHQEVIFVVEADKSDAYKFLLDLEKSSKDFDNISGDYEMALIVGDATTVNPIDWHLANLRLEMPGQPTDQSQSKNTEEARRSVAGSKRAASPRVGDRVPPSAKKLISHMFRPAEKRGGQTISSVFTILCIIPPFVMVALWLSMGVNLGNLELSLSSLLFHTGLVSIFGLYYCYWSYLNMFTTLRCLLFLGAGTAFFGNRVLRRLASDSRHK